jgi:hypothetical protein
MTAIFSDFHIQLSSEPETIPTAICLFTYLFVLHFTDEETQA